MDGWVKVYRTFVTEGHLQRMSDPALRIWLYLRLTVKWRPEGGLQVGQRVISYRNLRKETGYGLATIRSALAWLRDAGYIHLDRMGEGLSTVVTIQEPSDDVRSWEGVSHSDTGVSHSDTPVSESVTPVPGAPVTRTDTGVSEPVTPVSGADTPDGEGCIPAGYGVYPAQIRGVSQPDTPTGPQASGHAGSSPPEEEKKRRKDNDDVDDCARDEATPLSRVEQYLVGGRMTRLMASGRDIEEMRSWIELTGGNLEAIFAGIDAGLKVFQGDRPGKMPDGAGYYKGYVRKQWERHQAQAAPLRKDEANSGKSSWRDSIVTAETPRSRWESVE